jgi:Flp pilus assembly protein TadG
MLVFALIEFSRMMMVQQALTNAAREGSRTAVLATTKSGLDVESSVRDYLQSVMSGASDAGKVRVTVPDNVSNSASGSPMTVSVEVNYGDVSWLPFRYLGLDPTIAASQTAIRE